MDTFSYGLMREYEVIKRSEDLIGQFPLVNPNPLFRNTEELVKTIYSELEQTKSYPKSSWTVAGEITITNGVLLRESTFWVGGIYIMMEAKDKLTEMLADYAQTNGGEDNLVNSEFPHIFYLRTPEQLAHFITFAQNWQSKAERHRIWLWNDEATDYD